MKASNDKLEKNIALSLDVKREIRSLTKEIVADEVAKQLAALKPKKKKGKKGTKIATPKKVVKSTTAKFNARVHKAVEALCKKSNEGACTMVQICRKMRLGKADATVKQRIRRAITSAPEKFGQSGSTRARTYHLR